MRTAVQALRDKAPSSPSKGASARRAGQKAPTGQKASAGQPGGAGGGVPTPLMSEMRVAVIAAALVTIGPVTLSMYTPAMPTLVEAFGTTQNMVKATLTVFFLGYAFSQLVCGPLSDAFGRKPVALGFFGTYLAGSLVAVTATSMEWLIAGRLLQGVGCAAGIAISRAIVRDQYVGQASARIMNLVGTMLAIAPAVSPTIGGLLLGVVSWHGIFALMCLYGLFLVLVLVLMVPETNRNKNAALMRPVEIIRSYGQLLADRSFMRAGLVIGATLGGIYTMASLVPFVLIDTVGLSPVQFGMAMLMQTGAFMGGTLVTGRLLRRYGAMQLVLPALVLVLCGAAGLGVGLRVVEPSVLSVMGAIALWAFGVAMLMPGCTTAALANFPHIAGAASALTGFMQIGGGMCGTFAALLFPTPLAALMTLLPIMCLIALAAYGLLRPLSSGQEGEGAATAGPLMDATDLELAADPLGVVGAAGDEIEAGTFRRNEKQQMN